MRELWSRLDAADAGALFWVAVVYVLVLLFVWSLCRAAALSDRAALRGNPTRNNAARDSMSIHLRRKA